MGSNQDILHLKYLEIADFEDNIVSFVQMTKFWKIYSKCLQAMKIDIKEIRLFPDIIVATIKTRNMCKMTSENYDKLLTDSITQ